jgi:hypothetical protein
MGARAREAHTDISGSFPLVHVKTLKHITFCGRHGSTNPATRAKATASAFQPREAIDIYSVREEDLAKGDFYFKSPGTILKGSCSSCPLLMLANVVAENAIATMA